jgi:hypothetical protein
VPLSRGELTIDRQRIVGDMFVIVSLSIPSAFTLGDYSRLSSYHWMPVSL